MLAGGRVSEPIESIADVLSPPEQFNFAANLFELNAGRADKRAYIDDFGDLKFGDLARRARQFASALQSSGIKREQRILLVMQDSCDWPVSFLGSLYAGIVPVAVNTLATAEDYAYMLAHSRAHVVVTSGALVPVIDAAMATSAHEVRQVVVSRPQDSEHTDFETFLETASVLDSPVATHADEPAFWLYSSGSTGNPKGTVHTHANAYWTVELYGKALLGITANDVCFSAAKLFFAYGLGNALTFPLSVGATTILMAERPTPNAVFNRWLGEVGGIKPTIFFGAPTGYAGILAAPDLPAAGQVSLRLASSAGEALPADLGERFRSHFGLDIIDGIGSTEMLHIYLSNQPDRARYGSTGWPVPGYEIELRGDNGSAVADGEIGDLFVKGPSSALLYWNNRAKTRETFQGAWTKSGDKYVRNEDGSYTYSGRTDDMIKVSGIYVSPFEVEATLIEHEDVLEAAVIGAPDEDGLIKSKAFVVLTTEGRADEAELQAFVKERLAPYKYPRSIEFLEELPKTATGKIQRYKLREQS